jgi:branched-chain amino acid transport system permease protein
MKQAGTRVILLHAAVFAILAAAPLVLGEYALLSLTRVMVLAVYAVGYNLLFGYTGLLSLGHAMFFATGLYVAALGTTLFGLSVPAAFLAAIAAGMAISLVIGLLALRAAGVAFMIVTLMFSQAFYLTILYFGEYTRGDEGIVIPEAIRRFDMLGMTVDLADAGTRFNLAFGLLFLAVAACLVIVRSAAGSVLVAIRENENRTGMLGYDVARYKLFALIVSGTLSAVSGAAYALMFAYAGASLASIQYSIHPLLWTLLGGAATVLGPLIGTAIMFTLVDAASSLTSANLLVVGVALIVLVLFFPKGILGTIRARWLPWLP